MIYYNNLIRIIPGSILCQSLICSAAISKAFGSWDFIKVSESGASGESLKSIMIEINEKIQELTNKYLGLLGNFFFCKYEDEYNDFISL